jgi:DNA-binding transcriptional ArsR family regulator
MFFLDFPMSARATYWALRQCVGSPGAKLVLLVLADVSNAEGWSYYGQESLATMAELSVRTLRQHLGALEGAGLLERVRRSLADGSRTSDGYVLRLDSLPEDSSGSERGDNRKISTGQPEDSSGGSIGGLEPLGNRKEKEARAPESVGDGDLFDSGEIDEHARAVGQMCIRLRLPWPLKSTTIDEWCRRIRSEPRFAGLDFVYETRKAADHFDGVPASKRRRRVDATLRRWYENALKFAARDRARFPDESDEAGDDFAEREARRWDEMVASRPVDVDATLK